MNLDLHVIIFYAITAVGIIVWLCALQFLLSTQRSAATSVCTSSPYHQSINWSTDCQLDRLADTAEHFHEGIDGEFGRFFVHHVRHTRARDHQNLGGLGLL